MIRRHLFEGPLHGPLSDLLPPEFDPQEVARFFAPSQDDGPDQDTAGEAGRFDGGGAKPGQGNDRNADAGETTGTAAADALSDVGVPAETDGADGTAGVHWHDTTFRHEIMTGTLNASNTASDITVAALEDTGSETVYPDSFVFA
ncbi:hypothetical protein Ga0609869_003567 [Rhodovulum iodosum]|uniref:Uncharacterized protein n=1 Tax=Rhodovulum iodosum TaxID=68291 RepID=A0ABV3XY22_9RHOB|nr:hypothetical protein [Rhodovulum robiginosum]RSK38186.1 hypothetical protein EJA01_02580 [Rhodovulum robiginosum]